MSLFTTFNSTVGPCLRPCAVKASNEMSIKKHIAPTSTHQLRANKENLDSKRTSVTVSRREVMGLTGLSLAMISLSSPKPAEARTTRAEMKNKILEKLRELREKFGVPKPRDEGEEQTSEPQQEYSSEQKMFAYPGDEGKEAALKADGADGANSTPENDKSPFLPFLDLTEVDLAPLTEANVSQ